MSHLFSLIYLSPSFRPTITSSSSSSFSSSSSCLTVDWQCRAQNSRGSRENSRSRRGGSRTRVAYYAVFRKSGTIARREKEGGRKGGRQGGLGHISILLGRERERERGRERGRSAQKRATTQMNNFAHIVKQNIIDSQTDPHTHTHR